MLHLIVSGAPDHVWLLLLIACSTTMWINCTANARVFVGDNNLVSNDYPAKLSSNRDCDSVAMPKQVEH